ncbi:MAG: sulfite exporter TauE/SafE family protein [Oscillospiraceae bacterium]|jgi:uncharacterized membrane protein YfcA|nr:sulfite exporter TauE/SafE family protein [Oscillospiraceae bacterium]
MGRIEAVTAMNEFLIMSAAGFVAGAASSLGLGGGGILLLYLTLFANVEQLRAQGINLIFFIPCAVVALVMHAKENRIDFRAAMFLGGFGLIGAVGGYFLSGVIGGEWLSKIFGAYMLLLGAKELFFTPKAEKKAASDTSSVDR